MSNDHDCIHLYPLAGHVFTCGSDVQALVVEQRLIAICPDPAIANRLTQLVTDHGLLDVPDTLACPWPAPDPRERRSA